MERDTATAFDPSAIRTAENVDDWAARIFGAAPSRRGTLQVMAVWRRPDGGLEALSDGGDAPRCPEDVFVLGLARARADAILTTGAVLRQEPELRHQSDDDGPLAGALAAWRARRGSRRPATTVILTRSRDLDLDHPIFTGDQVIVFTGDDTPPSFGIELARRGAMLMTEADPTPRGCLARLAQAGFQAVTVESGPRVASTLYGEPVVIDELLLTTFLAPHLDAEFRRGTLIDESALAEQLAEAGNGYRTRTPDGPWLLRRFVR